MPLLIQAQQQKEATTTTSGSATIHSDYLPLTDQSIREAVFLWTSGVEDDRQIAEEFYGPIESWNTSLVYDMSRLFRNKFAFNEDISRWDVSRVLSFQLMFYGASAFTYDLSAWNVSSALNLGGMFVHASSFGQNLCWPMLSEFAFVEDMFCGTGGGALDPCCVPEGSVLSACCGDACSSFCFQTTTFLSDPTTATPTGKPPTGTSTTPTVAPTVTTSSPPATMAPTKHPTGAPFSLSTCVSLCSTDNLITHTFALCCLSTEAPTSTTVTELHITVEDVVNMTGTTLPDGFYSNDEQQDELDIFFSEPPREISFSIQDGSGQQGLQNNNDSSKKSGWIGGVVGFMVGAVAIASLAVTRKYYKRKREHDLMLLGKTPDEEGVEVELDDTLAEVPTADEEAGGPAPTFEERDIAIEQQLDSGGTEAVELSYDNTFQDYQGDNSPKDGFALFEDEIQSSEEDGNILPRVQLQEVRVFGKK